MYVCIYVLISHSISVLYMTHTDGMLIWRMICRLTRHVSAHYGCTLHDNAINMLRTMGTQCEMYYMCYNTHIQLMLMNMHMMNIVYIGWLDHNILAT